MSIIVTEIGNVWGSKSQFYKSRHIFVKSLHYSRLSTQACSLNHTKILNRLAHIKTSNPTLGSTERCCSMQICPLCFCRSSVIIQMLFAFWPSTHFKKKIKKLRYWKMLSTKEGIGGSCFSPKRKFDDSVWMSDARTGRGLRGRDIPGPQPGVFVGNGQKLPIVPILTTVLGLR